MRIIFIFNNYCNEFLNGPFLSKIYYQYCVAEKINSQHFSTILCHSTCSSFSRIDFWLYQFFFCKLKIFVETKNMSYKNSVPISTSPAAINRPPNTIIWRVIRCQTKRKKNSISKSKEQRENMWKLFLESKFIATLMTENQWEKYKFRIFFVLHEILFVVLFISYSFVHNLRLSWENSYFFILFYINIIMYRY